MGSVTIVELDIDWLGDAGARRKREGEEKEVGARRLIRTEQRVQHSRFHSTPLRRHF